MRKPRDWEEDYNSNPERVNGAQKEEVKVVLCMCFKTSRTDMWIYGRVDQQKAIWSTKERTMMETEIKKHSQQCQPCQTTFRSPKKGEW